MGESTGGGGNESDNQQDDGGRRPGDPQVFGVDGVSKTGSTSKDQQIGFTDGQGGRGANFDALQGATRQQTTAAVAAADAARNAGGGDTAAQQAVRGILDSYDPSAVNRQGNLTDSGRNLVNEAAQDALEFERITQDQQRAQFASDLIGGFTTNLGEGVAPQPVDESAFDRFFAEDATQPLDVTQPAGTGFADAETARIANLTPDEAAAENITVAQRVAAQAAMRGQTLSPGGQLQGPNLLDIFTEADLDPAAAQAAQRVQNELDFARQTAQRQQALDAVNRMVGITTLPEAATAGAVLQGNQPPRGTVTITRQAGPGDDTSSQQLFETLDPATQALINRAGTTAPDPLLTTGTAPAATSGPMQRVDPTQVGGISVPTPPPDESDIPFFDRQRFQTNDQRDFYRDIEARGLRGQFESELANLENRTTFGLGPRLKEQIEAGGVPNYDPSKPEGFRIRGVTNTRFVDLPFVGTTPISTYTGLDNPNALPDTSSDEPVTAKAPNDPCPAGYQLVNGVCQPVDDLTQPPDPPGSDFQINPTTGLPTVFQPTTVATPVGPINPFVLQPSPPVGINPPAPMPAQGIQALSPTGAALGRQV
tara:strand:+ start:5405 stop:7189 length:1785 start_codon:yes stop_codon:yes gene_type:complete